MKKFIGISTLIAVISAFVGVVCYRKGFHSGYKDSNSKKYYDFEDDEDTEFI